MRGANLYDRLLFKVEILRPDECWPFIGSRGREGYGLMWDGPKRLRAHRAAWTLEYGSIPDGLHVCHRCDNPPCCNPRHLFLATNSENVADRTAKGRSAVGVKNGHSRLSEAAVRVIRKAYETGAFSYADLARHFGLAHSTVRGLVQRTRWAWLSDQEKS